MIDAYVLFAISYIIAGIGIIACIMAYFLAPKVIRMVFNFDDGTEDSEKQ